MTQQQRRVSREMEARRDAGQGLTRAAREYVEAEHNKSPLHQSMTGGDLSLMCYRVKVFTC